MITGLLPVMENGGQENISRLQRKTVPPLTRSSWLSSPGQADKCISGSNAIETRTLAAIPRETE
jgi:hypothetical protein